LKDPLLHLLASFVELWTRCETLTLERGGIPEKTFLKNAIEGLQVVVVVSDVESEDDVIVANKRGGWRVPSALLIRSCLQDMRVLKLVQKIDGVMYNVNVYRDQDTIHFDAYDPSTSQIYSTSIAVSLVPDLLAPNSITVAKGLNKEPPQTSTEMYTLLSKLLRFEKASKQRGSRKSLCCHRDYSKMVSVTERINGHSVILTCSEAALGELYFAAYIAEYSCQFTLLVEDEMRLKASQNYDSVLEKAVIDTDDASLLLPYMIDRLRVHPSRPIVIASGPNPISRSAVITKHNHQGFNMKLRCRGGPGRQILCSSIRFAGTLHILRLKSVRACKTLRVIAYEPRTQRMMETRVSAMQRKLLFGTDSDDLSTWLPNLEKRLKLDWRGGHALQINMVIFKCVRRISGQRMIMSFHAISDEAIRVDVLNPSISVTFSATFTKDDIIRILNVDTSLIEQQTSISDKESGTGGFSKQKKNAQAVSKIIKTAVNAEDIAKVPDLDPVLFEVTLLSLLGNQSTLVHLSNQLGRLLERIEAKNVFSGYYFHVAVLATKLYPEKILSETKPAFETNLRYTGAFVRHESDGSTESVLATRKQPKFIYLEAELDILAEQKEEEARLLSEEIRKAAELLEASLNAPGVASLISITSQTIAKSLVDTIERRHEEEAELKDVPSTIELVSSDGTLANVRVDDITPAQREILIAGDRVVFERGAKVNFREGPMRWHGHVNVKVLEGSAWDKDDGVLRRLKFVVYEPSIAQYFSGEIRNTKHLREVLGTNAQDLLDPSKTAEMLLFISHYRLEMVRNTSTWDGEPLAEDETTPYYRVEFITDRLFSLDKITPVMLTGEAFQTANKNKLIDQGKYCILYTVLLFDDFLNSTVFIILN